MLTVGRLAVENVTEGCVTDSAHPLFTFNLDSDCQDDRMRISHPQGEFMGG